MLRGQVVGKVASPGTYYILSPIINVADLLDVIVGCKGSTIEGYTTRELGTGHDRRAVYADSLE